MKLWHLINRKTRRANRSKGFEELSDDVSNVLKKIVITLLIAVAVSQVALQIPQVRIWVTGVDRLEGAPL